MNTKIISLFVVLLISTALVAAHGEEDFAAAEELIASKTPCAQLSDDELELLGDYYMEQMHPGEAHEQMDAMMGGEGSAALRQMHINMAKSFYCGEHGAMSSQMMGMMMSQHGGMMNQGVLKNEGGVQNMMPGFGMMGGSGYWSMGFFSLVYVALAAFVFGVIFWWTRKLVLKK